MGFLSLNCQLFFLVFLQILIFNRSYSSFRAVFFSIEEISMQYNRD